MSEITPQHRDAQRDPSPASAPQTGPAGATPGAAVSAKAPPGGKSRPIPGSSGEVLTCLPSPYEAHLGTGLLHLPRFIAKIRYRAAHGELPKSYRKNFKRGFDGFLCLHLGVSPDAIEAAVLAATDDADLTARLAAILPSDLRAAEWNRQLVQKGMTEAGREFLREALTAMGCADRLDDVKCVADLIDFDEGRLL